MINESEQNITGPNIRKEKKKSAILEYIRVLSKDKTAIIGMVIVGWFVIWSLIQGILEEISYLPGKSSIGYILLPSDPFKIDFSKSLLAPTTSSLAGLLGTNLLGESILSRMLYAVPRDALVSLIVVLSAIVIGSLLGILAGYRGGWVETVIMRLTDAFLSLPALILVIAIVIPLKAGYTAVIIALSIVWWPTYTRFFRGQTLRVKEMDYVQAAKINNVKPRNLFLKYLFLNSVDPVIAYAALDFGNVILTYSTLAFLGIGLTTPLPELGSMSSNGLGYLPADWWYALFPGIAILIIVIGFVLVGDRFQDVINNRIDY
jgi:peptide/nickel transport system permease protein